jgi:predicted RNA-binding protein with PIN domain
MPLHIIIDGYNLIRQSHSLSDMDARDIQLGREALLDLLSEYKKTKRHKITVVFDGAKAPRFSIKKDFYKGINIRFSNRNEIADTVIKNMVAAANGQVMVVSSDLEIVNFAESKGASTISSHEFEEKMFMASYISVKGIEETSIPEHKHKTTTKKKGPGKRLSKKARRNRVHTKKL